VVTPSAAGQPWNAANYERHARFVAELGAPVLDLLAPKPGEAILDLGCGDGALTERIAACGALVRGCDASPELIEAARARALRVDWADAQALPYAAEFDAVFSNAALHWMTRPADVAAGVRRALRPGGRFVGEFGGFGNVAAATLQSFLANQDLIHAKSRSPIEFIRIATRTPSRAYGRVPAGCRVDDDPHALVEDPQVEVVIELTGNVPLGRELVLRALAQGKHVITANKALLARHGAEIMTAAAHAECRVLFEGAVAVSIPIIKTLREAAAANRISSVVGILNGTSNYVLSQMSEHGADFSTALAEAQRQGYAEADPTLDINGEDAAHKITLLASLAFGVPIDFDKVDFKGITDIEREDIEFAKRLGHQVKLIAQAKRVGEAIVTGVRPTLVPDRSMLALVSGSMNGIALQGDLLGSAFLYGSGAGGKQTSSAVLADLLELANGDALNAGAGAYNMGFRDAAPAAAFASGQPDLVQAFYIRLRLDDRAGALADVSRVLATANISVHSLLQDAAQGEMTDLVVITHPVSEQLLRKTLPQLQDAAGPGHSVVVLPVLEDCGC